MSTFTFDERLVFLEKRQKHCEIKILNIEVDKEKLYALRQISDPSNYSLSKSEYYDFFDKMLEKITLFFQKEYFKNSDKSNAFQILLDIYNLQGIFFDSLAPEEKEIVSLLAPTSKNILLIRLRHCKIKEQEIENLLLEILL